MKKEQLKNLRKKLENKKNFSGIGYGIQLKDKKPTDKKGILVGVYKKEEEKDLDPSDVIPKEIDGHETDVIELDLKHLNWRSKHRPIRLGASCCHEDLTACSFGLPLFVENILDEAPKEVKDYFEIGDPCVMLNAHCGSPEGAEVGDAIVNPSPVDGKEERIGEVSPIMFKRRFDSEDNLDTMVAKLEEEPLLEDVEGHGYDKETRWLDEGDILKEIKGGSRTINERRTGVIISVDFMGRANSEIEGRRGVLNYEDCVLVFNESKEGGAFVKGGCSSSVRFVDNKPLTQVFLGDKTIGVMNQVQKSLDKIKEDFGVVFSLEPIDLEDIEGYVAISHTFQGKNESKVRLNVRSEPGVNSKIIKTLNEGDKFKEVDNKFTYVDGYRWMKIKLVV